MKINENLIKGCIKGDRHCQKTLYETCAPYVYTVVKHYISDSEFIKDVMQDCFAEIFKSLQTYNPNKGSFKSWISKITVFRSIDLLKKNGKVKFTDSLEIIMNFPDDQYLKLNNLSQEEINLMLQNMPEGYRTIFLLNIIDEYTHKEISDMLEISIQTSRSQLSRSLQWIRKNITNLSKFIAYEAL